MKQEQRALSESRGSINTTKSRDAATHTLTRRRTTRATATSPVDASAARRKYASSNARARRERRSRARSESRGAINTTKSRDAATHILTRRRTTRATATSPVDASAARRKYASSNARGETTMHSESSN